MIVIWLVAEYHFIFVQTGLVYSGVCACVLGCFICLSSILTDVIIFHISRDNEAGELPRACSLKRNIWLIRKICRAKCALLSLESTYVFILEGGGWEILWNVLFLWESLTYLTFSGGRITRKYFLRTNVLSFIVVWCCCYCCLLEVYKVIDMNNLSVCVSRSWSLMYVGLFKPFQISFYGGFVVTRLPPNHISKTNKPITNDCRICRIC